MGRQRHGLIAARPLDPVILPPEGDAGAVGCDQAAIGDGDPVGVARQIGEYGPGAAERPLGIDHPIDLAQRRQIRLEGSDVIEAGVDAEKLQRRPARWAATSLARNNPRNRHERTFTGRIKSVLHGTHRVPSMEVRPPGTIMWTWG